MIKTVVLTLLLTSTMASAFFTSESTATDLTTELIGSANSLNDSSDFSASLVKTSEDMLNLSKSLLTAGSQANTEYVEAMLLLSQDILEMADKIGEMADRILIMADNIGEMADRILETQRIQSANVSKIQFNILLAQENFHTILN